jgi:hypothetical protein
MPKQWATSRLPEEPELAAVHRLRGLAVVGTGGEGIDGVGSAGEDVAHPPLRRQPLAGQRAAAIADHRADPGQVAQLAQMPPWHIPVPSPSTAM